MTEPQKKTRLFVVGRIHGRDQSLVFVRTLPRPPFPGPWELRAVLAQ